VTSRGIVAAVALVVTIASSACGSSEHQYAGIQREPAPVVDGDSLPDAAASGTPMELRAATGGLLLVYFGYTLCPDVCPTTMSDLRLALGDMRQADRSQVHVAMVTVDPERDTATVLKRYVRSFINDGSALRTDDRELLARVARAFGASYGVTKKPDGTVEVSHTAFVYAVDDEGRLLLQWSFGTPWQDIHDDLVALLATQGGDS
jgi:protein SCO1/2